MLAWQKMARKNKVSTSIYDGDRARTGNRSIVNGTPLAMDFETWAHVDGCPQPHYVIAPSTPPVITGNSNFASAAIRHRAQTKIRRNLSPMIA